MWVRFPPTPLITQTKDEMKKEIIKLRNADVGDQVDTFDIENGKPILVGVNRLSSWLGSQGICPCITCAFGCWKSMKTEVQSDIYDCRISQSYVYDVRCPLFDACNAKDRPDHESVNFTKIQEL